MSLKHKILHEVRKTALATAFFLFGFNLLALLLAALAPGSNNPLSLFATATLAALVVGKVMVIADGLLNRFLRRKGTLLVAVLKKAAALTVVVALALMVEALIHGMREGLTLGESWQHRTEQASFLGFLARSTYLILMFSFYLFVFELDAYFAPHSVADIVFSRYHRPATTRSTVMCIGPTVPLPREQAAERLAIVQDMYSLFQEQAAAHGAELELFDATRAFVIWRDAAKATNDDVEATFAGMQAVLDERREELARHAGRPLALKAGVATGELVTAELSGAGRRQVARDGPVLDRASAIFDALDEPRIQLDRSLTLSAAGTVASS